MTIKTTTAETVLGLVIVRADGGSNRFGHFNALVFILDVELK